MRHAQLRERCILYSLPFPFHLSPNHLNISADGISQFAFRSRSHSIGEVEDHSRLGGRRIKVHRPGNGPRVLDRPSPDIVRDFAS